VNFLDGRVVTANDGTAAWTSGGVAWRCPPRCDIRPGEPVTLVVRPETIRLAPAATAGRRLPGGDSPGGLSRRHGGVRIGLGGNHDPRVNGSPLEHGVLAEAPSPLSISRPPQRICSASGDSRRMTAAADPGVFRWTGKTAD